MSEPTNEVMETAGADVPRRRRFRWKSVLAGLAILLCGMVIGSVLTAHIGRRMMLDWVENPEKMAERMTHRFQGELDLTPEQSAEVKKIVSTHAHTVAATMQDFHKQMGAQFDQVHDEVSKLLDPGQKIKWDEHYRKMKQRFEQHGPRKEPR